MSKPIKAKFKIILTTLPVVTVNFDEIIYGCHQNLNFPGGVNSLGIGIGKNKGALPFVKTSDNTWNKYPNDIAIPISLNLSKDTVNIYIIEIIIIPVQIFEVYQCLFIIDKVL